MKPSRARGLDDVQKVAANCELEWKSEVSAADRIGIDQALRPGYGVVKESQLCAAADGIGVIRRGADTCRRLHEIPRGSRVIERHHPIASQSKKSLRPKRRTTIVLGHARRDLLVAEEGMEIARIRGGHKEAIVGTGVPERTGRTVNLCWAQDRPADRTDGVAAA